MQTNKWAMVLSVLAASTLPLSAIAAEDVKEAAKGDKTEVCTVTCVDPHVCCKESQKVLEILQKLVTAYSSGDLKTYEEYLDEHCTTFNEGTKQVLSGKSAVLSELKNVFAEHASGGTHPLKKFTIDQPYAKVSPTGDTCVVTFVAYKETGGAHPLKEKSDVTDIFIKRGDQWKKFHWRGRWETVQ